ncbi:MAG: hypothetical protein IKT52_15145 [Oscillospiraceae bacterium]|nr:hypothetical protein [Oscillospiraceae bacterium]
MEQNEFNRADREVEQVVNANHAKFRAAEQMACGTNRIPNWTETGKIVRRRAWMRRVGNTAFRLLPVLMFLGAASRGLMDAGFACLMTFASLVWGLNYFMRGYRYE